MPEVQRNSVHGFTDHEKALIKKTWRVVSNNMPGVGAKIFLKIFSLRPQVKQIFPCRDVTGEDLLRDTHFRGHASRFMQAVGAAVDNINDLDQAMAPLLFGLGTQHIHYSGFKPEYFDIFIVAILEVFAEELGSKYTEGVATAWRRVVEFIISKLKEGYVHALEKERLD
ncbi:cytoglobin-2-like [Mya arenaria]|uniref:cytoglobin-2-like n=1 Tax=Mya arenaria TaxID=6604 RepID=UPI0022E97E25|nr:cytoglobin-2-like [Mya arenaria]